MRNLRAFLSNVLPFGAIKRTIILILILSVLPLLLAAQPSGFAGSFTRVGFGPRGMAMGNAITAEAGEGIYAYYNPAFAAYARKGSQVDISTSIMSFDRTLNGLNATFQLPPSAGLTVSLLNANVRNIDGRTPDGYFTSQLETHEYQLMTSFGVNISPAFALGLGVKLNLADYHPEVSPAKGVGFDIGVVYKASDKLSFGFTAQDLLASYSWNSAELYGDESLSETTEDFPLRFNLGTSYRLQPEIVAAFNYGILIHDGKQFSQLNLGFSWLIHERLSLRGGWQVDDLKNYSRSNRPSAGFSIHLPFDILEPSIDYAYMREPNGISSMHVFGLKMRL